MPTVLLAVSAQHQVAGIRTFLAVTLMMRSLVHRLARVKHVLLSRPLDSSSDPFLQSSAVASPEIPVEASPKPADSAATEARTRSAY